MPPKKGKTYDRPTKKDIQKALEDVPKEDMADQEEERYAKYPDTEKD